MDHLNIILIGFAVLILSLSVLIFNVVKGKYKVSLGMISLVIIGVAFIIAGFVLPDSKEKMLVSGDAASSNGVINYKEATSNETSSNESTRDKTAGYVAINDDLIINESDPLRITRALVELEMSKQVGLKEWRITENNMTSDQNVFNIADYDKPVGDMRKVWIEGNINATVEDDGTNGNIGYDLELYQMRGDTTWYVGKHWGVLIDLNVTAKPKVEENLKYHSNSDEMIIDEETGGLSSVEVPEYGTVDNVFKSDKSAFAESDLMGAWHWSELDDFYMILRNDYTYSYIEKGVGFVSEGAYTVDQFDDHFQVKVHYTTGEYDSVMMIKLIDKNHLKGNEDGFSWEASRVNLSEAEDTLNSFK
ncbi:hypothetical protein [Sporosarcina sp. E16_8]|uniref:hypothetical protein n=1 Tax=Sporosarcina sp. E16_8 TaxID=2789295 RepID=UPI001A910113|nr:hypothetical protein [Sporosarcina sp. E16_8]MBO0588981.1 hypothetical protein [Sporosarcina sp. E16_8]